MLQGLHYQQGMRQQLYQSVEELSQADRLRVQRAVMSAYCE